MGLKETQTPSAACLRLLSETVGGLSYPRLEEDLHGHPDLPLQSIPWECLLSG